MRKVSCLIASLLFVCGLGAQDLKINVVKIAGNVYMLPHQSVSAKRFLEGKWGS